MKLISLISVSSACYEEDNASHLKALRYRSCLNWLVQKRSGKLSAFNLFYDGHSLTPYVKVTSHKYLFSQQSHWSVSAKNSFLVVNNKADENGIAETRIMDLSAGICPKSVAHGAYAAFLCVFISNPGDVVKRQHV